MSVQVAGGTPETIFARWPWPPGVANSAINDPLTTQNGVAIGGAVVDATNYGFALSGTNLLGALGNQVGIRSVAPTGAAAFAFPWAQMRSFGFADTRPVGVPTQRFRVLAQMLAPTADINEGFGFPLFDPNRTAGNLGPSTAGGRGGIWFRRTTLTQWVAETYLAAGVLTSSVTFGDGSTADRINLAADILPARAGIQQMVVRASGLAGAPAQLVGTFPFDGVVMPVVAATIVYSLCYFQRSQGIDVVTAGAARFTYSDV